jgi:DNA repair photolyase
VRSLLVSNPWSRFVTTATEYDDGEAPTATYEVQEDHSKSILSGNDSPDVGFRWSVNPYRGCLHACSYCQDGDTRILMGDGNTRALRDLRVGDEIYGTRLEGAYRRYTRTTVLAHWQSVKRAYRITLADGTELIASGDHRFLTDRGWKYVTGAEQGRARRPFLTTSNRLIGTGSFAMEPPRTHDYERGYLTGMVRGDALLKSYRYSRPGGAEWDSHPLGGMRERLRFLHLTQPAIRRKCGLDGVALKQPRRLQVVSIEDLGFELLMFDITTGTGDFIANGVVSHNCYARPTHEYLSLGAGTDFERKIVVKPRAPELLREAFDKKSWQGELVVFSGITDCYQPLEAKMRLTRGCLEVCAAYRNPVGIITKSPVIERDVDLLQELARVASVRVSISVPFWDPDVARAIEPMVTTPLRRLKIIETLAKAGISVGVSISPIVPGLNDEHVGRVIARAREAGATHAFYVLLRLPGPVKEVFETRLRAALPLRAEKVFRRLREAHDGKVYDSTFGTRGRGSGPYADTFRQLFERAVKKHGLNDVDYDARTTFRRPSKTGQTSFGFE